MLQGHVRIGAACATIREPGAVRQMERQQPRSGSRWGTLRQALLRSLAGLAWLALAALPMASAAGAGTLNVHLPRNSPEALVLTWEGGVAAPMADAIRSAFEAHSRATRRVVFRINSGGGSVAEGERVIAVLREIRSSHRLQTVVEPGAKCGSMCVFIYLQGEQRFAGLSSLWLFHEVSHHDPVTRKLVRLDRKSWERLVDLYFAPAGVSADWTQAMKPLTIRSDYWQTGSDLLRDKSGIFHVALGNQRDRLHAELDPTRPGKTPEPSAPTTPPSTPQQHPLPPKPEPKEAPRIAQSWETKECRELNPEARVYVSVPCRR